LYYHKNCLLDVYLLLLLLLLVLLLFLLVLRPPTSCSVRVSGSWGAVLRGAALAALARRAALRAASRPALRAAAGVGAGGGAAGEVVVNTDPALLCLERHSIPLEIAKEILYILCPNAMSSSEAILIYKSIKIINL